jgi:hypothetical protein
MQWLLQQRAAQTLTLLQTYRQHQSHPQLVRQRHPAAGASQHLLELQLQHQHQHHTPALQQLLLLLLLRQ